MSADSILSQLAARGVTLSADGDRPHYRGRLTPADRQTIRSHKPQLLAALQLRTRPAVTLPPMVEGIPWLT